MTRSHCIKSVGCHSKRFITPHSAIVSNELIFETSGKLPIAEKTVNGCIFL